MPVFIDVAAALPPASAYSTLYKKQHFTIATVPLVGGSAALVVDLRITNSSRGYDFDAEARIEISRRDPPMPLLDESHRAGARADFHKKGPLSTCRPKFEAWIVRRAEDFAEDLNANRIPLPPGMSLETPKKKPEPAAPPKPRPLPPGAVAPPKIIRTVKPAAVRMSEALKPEPETEGESMKTEQRNGQRTDVVRLNQKQTIRLGIAVGRDRAELESGSMTTTAAEAKYSAEIEAPALTWKHIARVARAVDVRPKLRVTRTRGQGSPNPRSFRSAGCWPALPANWNCMGKTWLRSNGS